jgi:hypothetical protein
MFAALMIGHHFSISAFERDELVRMKPHGLPAARAVDAIVLPAERDAGVVGCNEAAVRDGETMGVTGEIFWRIGEADDEVNALDVWTPRYSGTVADSLEEAPT